MEKHKIDWLNKPGFKGETWNPIIGCDKVSAACANCYALTMSIRLARIKSTSYYGNVVDGKKWNGKTYFVESALDKPLHWEKPRMIFVCSMSDLFHENNSFEDIDKVIQVISQCPQHIFILLTKRPKRALEFYKWFSNQIKELGFDSIPSQSDNPFDYYSPLENLWLMTTVESQKHIDRIGYLLQCPAVVHGISIEPMLSEMDLSKCLPKLNWVICGGESGHNARPMHPDWVRSIRDQCKEAGTPFFFKQWGHWIPEDLWPEDFYLDMGKVLYIHDHNENYFPIGTKKSGSELVSHHHKEFPT